MSHFLRAVAVRYSLSTKRQDSGILCVVESPSDVLAIEQTGQYLGLYFVLMGHLSPIDGIGPKEIGLDVLERQSWLKAV